MLLTYSEDFIYINIHLSEKYRSLKILRAIKSNLEERPSTIIERKQNPFLAAGTTRRER